MDQGPALEELTDCQGEVALVLNTSQILISSPRALIILLECKSDLIPAQHPSKAMHMHLKLTCLKVNLQGFQRLQNGGLWATLGMLCFVWLTVFLTNLHKHLKIRR